MPGFTEHSQVPKMFAAAGLPYPELLDLLVTDALAGQAPMRAGSDSMSPAAVRLHQLDLAAASSRLEARLRYGFQCRARSATSAGSGR